jgi:penicillin-binding protein 1C
MARTRCLLLATLALPVLLAVALLLLDRLAPPNLARLAAHGVEVQDREGRTLSVLPAPGGVWRLATTPAEVPPIFLDLLIAAEDRRFRTHAGIDPFALARATWQFAAAGGRVVSGGSTLSMQAARLLEPRPRTLRSKAIELARAAQLEWRFGKDGVLAIWLTLAPMGGNIEGVRAGALTWFGKPAHALDPAEAALLVAIPRRPEALRPDRHPDRARAARDAVLLYRAAHAPGVTAEDTALALAAPVPTQRRPMPRLAPHLARDLARHAPRMEGGSIATTLDLPLQRATEGLVLAALRDLPERASAAAMILDIRTREVRALVGGEYGAQPRAGMLDLTRAVRSPGSALKPLLYAMAFESGIVAPETVLADLPRRFGAYAPENFDRGFAGRVSVADALRHSLNLPAVALLSEIGPIRYASALKSAGLPPRLPPGADAALPLALGGFGTTLRELTGLFATLADDGMAAPIRVQPGEAAMPRRVLDARAAGLAAAILVRPFPAGGPPGIAWKTGTSWGGRDAWAMGFDGRHVVGVWVGRPDGTPLVPGHEAGTAGTATGLRTALPLLARLFERLPPAPRATLPVRAGPGASGAEPLDRLRLLFPPHGAVLAAGGAPGGAPGGAAEGAEHVTLRATGGRRPLTFLVDGAPIPAEAAKREARWIPASPGFYRVTVLDAAGAVARAEVRVR